MSTQVTDTSSQKDRLTSLPPELVEYIAEHTDAEDLPSLRLVSNACKVSSQRAFESKCFTERKIVLASEDSLLRSLAVLEDKHYPTFLRSVVVFLDEPQAGAMDQAARTARTRRENGTDLRLLTAFFKRLRELDMRPKITVTSRASEHISNKQTKALKRLQSPPVDDIESFNIVLDAMVNARFQLLEFSININADPQAESWFLPVHKFVLDERVGVLSDVFTSVKSLTLDVWFDSVEDDVMADYFFKTVSSLPNLEFLTVYARLDLDQPLEDFEPSSFGFSEALLKHDFPQLKVFKLWGAFVYAQPFVDFLRRHHEEHELQELHMGHVSTDSMGPLQRPGGLIARYVDCKALSECAGLPVAFFKGYEEDEAEEDGVEEKEGEGEEGEDGEAEDEFGEGS